MGRLLYRNFALVYRLDGWFKARLTPGGRLLATAVVASGVFGVDLSRSYAFQIFALSLSLAGVAALGAMLSRPGVGIHRRLPRFATAGETLFYRAEVTGRRGRTQAGVVLREDPRVRLPEPGELGPGGASYQSWLAEVNRRRGLEASAHRLPPLPAHGAVTIDLTAVPQRRGWLRLGRMQVMRSDPLGLINALCYAAAPASVLVLPRTYPLPDLQPAAAAARQANGMVDPRSAGGTAAFRLIREYRAGDSLRHVDWRAYARADRLMVKEFHDERQSGLAIYLDTRLDRRGPGPRPDFECAVSVAGSLVRALLIPDEGELALFPGTGYALRRLRHPEQALAQLATVSGQPRDPHLEAAALVRHLTAPSTFLVLLGWDPARQALARRLARRRRSGLVVLAVTEETVPAPSGERFGLHRIRPSAASADLRAFAAQARRSPRRAA